MLGEFGSTTGDVKWVLQGLYHQREEFTCSVRMEGELGTTNEILPEHYIRYIIQSLKYSEQLPQLPKEFVDLLRSIEIHKPVISKISLFDVLKSISGLSKGEVYMILKNYADENMIKLIIRERDIDEYALASVLAWIENNYKCYGKPVLDAMFDPETSELQFVTIVLPDCDWLSWKRIAKEVKEEMRKCNLTSLASKVAVVCLRGLQE